MRNANPAILLPLATFLASLLLMSTVASGQSSFDDLPRKDQKRFAALLDRCITAYDRQRFDEALNLCEQAAAIVPHPATTYVQARILDRRANCADALPLYKQLAAMEAPGHSETKWLNEYRSDLDKHLTDLNECRVLLQVDCHVDDHGAWIIIDDVVERCPATIERDAPGTAMVRILAPKTTITESPVELSAGRTTRFLYRPKTATPSTSELRIDCPTHPQGGVLFVDDTARALCGEALDLPPGRHQVTARDHEGRVAVTVIDNTHPEHPVAAAPALLRRVHLGCAQAESEVTITSPSLLEPLHGDCAALAASTLRLPEGTVALSVSQSNSIGVTLSFDVNQDEQVLSIPALAPRPILVTVRCEQDDDAAIFVRIGDASGPCPFVTELQQGSYAIEARAQGRTPWKGEAQLRYDGEDTFWVPPLEQRSFWSPGVFVSAAGAGLLIAALAVDLAGLSDLNLIKDLDQKSKDGVDVSDQVAAFNAAKDRAKTTVTATRILYSAGTVVAAAGVGLLIYEWLAADPSSFEEEASTWQPHIIPVAGADNVGMHLRWRF